MAKFIVRRKAWAEHSRPATEADAVKAARAVADGGDDAAVYRDGRPWRLVRGGDSAAVMDLTPAGWIAAGVDPTKTQQ